MSLMIIEYLNKQKEKYDITGMTVKVMEKFINIEEEQLYIPLCNVKSIKIKGTNQIKE